MTAPRPPFRADHVGSLLRSPALKARRREREEGRIDAAAVAAAEDEAVRGPRGLGRPVGDARSRSPAQSAAGSSTQAVAGTVTVTGSPGRTRAGAGPVTRRTTSLPSSATW